MDMPKRFMLNIEKMYTPLQVVRIGAAQMYVEMLGMVCRSAFTSTGT
jgi:hypothetical protein